MGSKLGRNENSSFKATRPFVCEFPAIDEDRTITNADLMAALAGATYANGKPVDGDSYLNEVSATLTHQGDEASDGAGGTFVTTSCQATVEDCETAKVTDLEPGGSYALSVAQGMDVPNFTMVVAQGSNLKVCGETSVCCTGKGENVVVVPRDETPVSVDKATGEGLMAGDTSADFPAGSEVTDNQGNTNTVTSSTFDAATGTTTLVMATQLTGATKTLKQSAAAEKTQQ